ncbi:AAA family ATPase [Dactylosporangium sp. CS-033363]|uniref:AAA family ATPase n=1 Tax=Dactylosporangium sp. CS-033363 TaxID=3239935 RepID=UPI003D916D7C
MIVWLNGPSGVGKGTVTNELCRREPRARAFDAERIGWVMQRAAGLVRPGVRHGDYRDLPAWRAATVAAAARQARGADPLLVPMTMLRRGHLEEILGALRDRGHEVRHVLLDVSAPALVERVEADDGPDSRGWRLEDLGAYLTARRDLRPLGEVVDTDDLDPDEVADEVQQLIDAWRRNVH